MPFKDLITSEEFNAVPEADRVLYVKKAGENGAADSYSLHPSFVAERTALSANNQTLKTEKQKAAELLKTYQDLGLTAEQIKDLQTAKEAADAAKLTDAEKKKNADDALKTAHKAEIERVNGESKKREDFLTKELRRNMIEAVAQIAIEKAGVIEGAGEALLPHIVAAMTMVEDGEGDGRKMVTRIVGADGNPRYVGSEFMKPEQLVDEYKQKAGFGGLFKATGAGGGGASQQNKGSGAPGGQMKRAAFDALSPEAKHAHVKASGTIVD